MKCGVLAVARQRTVARVLRTVLGHKGEELTDGEENCTLGYFMMCWSQNVIRIMRRKMRWAVHVVCSGEVSNV